MQTHGGEAAEAAILAKERHFFHDVVVDWTNEGFAGPMVDLSPYIEDITVDRGLEGTVPEEVQVVEGSAAAELTLTVGGFDPVSGLSMVEVFSDFNSRSPLHGQDLIGAEIIWDLWVETEEGPVQYRQFTGNVRTISPNRESGTVEITALDRVEKLRQPVTLTPWAYSHAASNEGLLEGQLQNSQAVIDAALRSGGVSPTPYMTPPPGLWENPNYFGEHEGWGGCHFYLTGTGSVPLIGFWDEPDTSTYFDVEGTGTQMFTHSGLTHPSSPDPSTVPLGIKSKGVNASILYYRGKEQKPMRVNGTHYIGFTLLTNDGNYWQTTGADRVVFLVEIEQGVEIRVLVREGQLWSTWTRIGQPSKGITEVVRTTEKVNIPTGQYAVRVNVRWAPNFNTSRLRATVTVGSNTTGDKDVHVYPSTTPAGNRPSWGRIMIRDFVGLADIYYYSRAQLDAGEETDVVNRPAPYCAVLDPGLNRVSNYPTVKSEDGWDLIKEVASAELGAAFWDENGVFHFWNYNRIKNKQSQVVKTLSPDELSGLSMARSLDSLRNELSVSRTKAVSTSWRSIYEATDADEFRVPPGTRRFFIIQSDDFVAADDRPLTQYKPSGATGTLPTWNQYVKHGFILQRWQPGSNTWVEHLSALDELPMARVEQDGFIILEFYNGFANTIRFAFGENVEPALRIGGSMRVTYDPAVSTYKDQVSVNKFGRRNLQISNRWIQYGSPNTLYASYLSDRASRVVPVADQEIECPGDPRIQLGDTIAVKDEDGFGDDFRMQITGITRSYSPDNGLRDTYTVELFPAS